MLSRLEWIGILLVALGVLRAAALVAHSPVIGYGNQYDMHRTGACVGLFPAIEGEARYRKTPEAPIGTYGIEAPRDGCYASTESLIAAGAVALSRLAGNDPARLDLRWVGAVKLAFLALTALALALLLRAHPVASLLHGIIVLAILCDPVATLWLNGLYTEFSIAWSLYAAIGAACVLALRASGGWLAWPLLVLALAALAFSREQFALLPVALAAVAAPWLWSRNPIGGVTVMIAAIASSAIAFAAERPGQVHAANRANVYLGTVVPASADPLMALSKLQLPARCEPLVGASWYLQRGESIEELCPQVFRLSSVAFLRFVDEPDTLARAMARVLPTTQHVVPPYLGVLEGRKSAPIESLGLHGLSPWHALLMALPIGAYAGLALAMFLLAPIAFLAALAWARPARGSPGVALMLAMMLGGVAMHAYLTTVFGDGFSEAGRHYWAGHLAAFAALIALGVAIATVFTDWLRAPRDHGMKLVAIVAAIGLASLVAHYAWEWAKREALAFGVLDEPAGRRVPGGGFTIRGWALDPFGVQAVTVQLGRRTLSPRAPSSPQPDLRPYFPGYPDAASGWYALDVKPEDLAGAGPEVPLRVVVRNRLGASTPIDARRLEIAE